MSRVLKVSNGDYRIQVQASSPTQDTPTIFLDTGDQLGRVVITGNLDVKGVTTTVESTTTTIADGIITLNKGQAGAGVGALPNTYQSGIEIDRGSSPKARLVFDEQVAWYDSDTSVSSAGGWKLQLTTGAIEGLQVSKIANASQYDGVHASSRDLQFDLQNGLGGVETGHSHSAMVRRGGDLQGCNRQRVVIEWISGGLLHAGRCERFGDDHGHGVDDWRANGDQGL